MTINTRLALDKTRRELRVAYQTLDEMRGWIYTLRVLLALFVFLFFGLLFLVAAI